jgi:N-acetylmuramoyl-L-alanine amidase
MVGMDEQSARRRPILKAVVGGVVAVGAVGGAARVWQGSDGSGAPGRRPSLLLAGESSSALSSLDVPLDGKLLGRVGPSRWESAAMSSSQYSMVAFTWPERAGSPRLQVRSRSGGRWRGWRAVPRLHDQPDLASTERTHVAGTDLVWVGPSDGIQLRVDGQRPRGLKLVLLQPWRQPQDESVRAVGVSGVPGRAAVPGPGLVPRPALLGRQEWGADESWRSGEPRYNTTIEQVHVHHTVNSNDYSEADVPALIRGMYRYHTHSLGWSDIAYNFLVDRFGRVWTGRAGGVDRPVRGAHTLGFNSTSAGVSVIGNFELVDPAPEVMSAIAAVAAWKLNMYGRDPLASAPVTSEGSDKFQRNQVVTLPVVDGHRDTNDTACPGTLLYERLPEVRTGARSVVDLYSTVAVAQPATVAGVPALGGTLTVTPGQYVPPDAVPSFAWLRDGTEIPGAGGAVYQAGPADVGSQLAVRVTTSKDGLQPAVETLTAPGVVRARATLTLKATGKKPGHLGVVIKVVGPPGVALAPTGQVVILVNERRAVVELSEGRAVARFGASSPFKPGRYQVRATYRGDGAYGRERTQIRARVTK